MSCYDSLDITLDTGTLPEVNTERMNGLRDKETGWWIYTMGTKDLEGKPEYLGVGGVRYTPGALSLRFSAKIHGPEYFGGTHRDNADGLAERWRATDILPTVTADDLLRARVTRADPYLDLALGEGLSDYTAAMHVLTETGGDLFRRVGRRSTPTFYAQLGASDMVLRQYGKAPDIRKGGRNRTFRDTHAELGDQAEREGRHRFELNGNSLPHVRRLAWMASGEPTLGDLLNAPPSTPIADTLDRTLGIWESIARKPMPLPSIPNSAAEHLETFADLSPTEAGKRLYARQILDVAGGDLDKAEGILRATHGHNWKRTLHPYILAEAERRAAVQHGLTRAPDRSPVARVRSILSDVFGAVREAETVRATR